jgi:hypothetical protein
MKTLSTIALFFALALGLSAQSYLPFNEPLQQAGTTVQLLVLPSVQPGGFGVSVAPADLQATAISITVAVRTDVGHLVCTVSGPVDSTSAFTGFGIQLPRPLVEVTALRVVTSHDTAFGYFPSTCVPVPDLTPTPGRS